MSKFATFKPISSKVVIVKDEAEVKTDGGILLADLSQEKPQTGVVLAKGPGSQNRGYGSRFDMEDIEIGSRVIFEMGTGFNFKLNGKEYLSIPVRSILAVIEKAE